MIRRFIYPSLFAFLACFLSLPGCGGGGGEAAYDASASTEQTAAEIEEADDYMKEYEADNARQDGPQ